MKINDRDISYEDLPEPIRELFAGDEVETLVAAKTDLGDRIGRSAFEHALAWGHHVWKLEDDLTRDPDDHTIWTMDDLRAVLEYRDYLATAMARIRGVPSELRVKLESYIAPIDDRYRALTVEDSGRVISIMGRENLAGRGWWWFRRPVKGVLGEEFDQWSRYVDEHYPNDTGRTGVARD